MTRKPTRLNVFDFDDDDERVQHTSKKLLEKFQNPKRKRHRFTDSPITKYSFLQCFAGHTKSMGSEAGNEPIYVDDGPNDIDPGVAAGFIGSKTPCKGNIDFKECELIDVDDELIDVEIEEGSKTLFEGNNDGLADNCTDGSDTYTELFSSLWCTKNENSSANEYNSQTDVLVLSSSSNYENDCLGRVEDDDGIIEKNLATTSISTPADNKVSSEDEQPQYGSVGHEIDFVNMKVVVFPDFIMYGDTYCTESCLIFSSRFIRIEGSNVSGAGRTLVTEWDIGDVIDIESEWCELVETAMISIRLKLNVSNGRGGASQTLGVDKLKFSVYDPCWFVKEDAIKSLDARYNDIWNVVLNNDDGKQEDAFVGRTDTVISKPYYYNHDETFGDVIYPDGDPDAVLISKRDLELLQPQRFINDTIIDFYIKFLKLKIPTEDQDRFYFFNSFFFKKLTGLGKDLSNINEGREAFERVRKWTRKVDLFKKDYIFIPVNYSLHWSLILICHPGEVINSKDDNAEKSQRVPCILHMDSIKGSHKGLKNLIQSYLCEEWKARHNESAGVVSSKFLDLRFVSLELPQQENSFDCGLFLLHYVELFLEEAPTNFNPFKITQFSNFLHGNWFLPVEASLKRVHIKELIYQIYENQIQKGHSVDSTGNHYSFDPPPKEHAVRVEHCFKEGCSSPNGIHGYSGHNSDTGIDFSSLSPPRILQRVVEPEDFSEPGTSGKSLLTETYHQVGSCDRTNFLSPLLEVEEQSCKWISDSFRGTENCRVICGSVSESPNSYFRGEPVSLRSSFRREGCIQFDKICNNDDIGISLSGSQKSSEIGLDDDSLDTEFDVSSVSKRVDPPSIPIEDIAACIVEDSLDECFMNDADSPSFHSIGNNFSLELKESDYNGIVGDDLQIVNEDAGTICVEQATHEANMLKGSHCDS